MSNRIDPGVSLHINQYRSSSNIRFFFNFQVDGNLVLYENPDWERGVLDAWKYRPLWASDTVGKPSKVCAMQLDGNFVIYDSSDRPIWASGTLVPGSWLLVQDDGNVVIYNPDNLPVWSTDTMQEPLSPTGPLAYGDDMQPGEILKFNQYIASPNGQFAFLFQDDGNLVLYEDRGLTRLFGDPLSTRAMWASGTFGKPSNVCMMQYDGNLVLYSGLLPIWNSGTFEYPGSRLVVQDDGNVVIYKRDNTPVWATGTN